MSYNAAKLHIVMIKNFYHDRSLLKEYGNNGRNYVTTYFDRSVLAKELWNKLQSI